MWHVLAKWVTMRIFFPYGVKITFKFSISKVSQWYVVCGKMIIYHLAVCINFSIIIIILLLECRFENLIFIHLKLCHQELLPYILKSKCLCFIVDKHTQRDFQALWKPEEKTVQFQSRSWDNVLFLKMYLLEIFDLKVDKEDYMTF